MGVSDQDQSPTLHKSIARQDHLLMIAETRTIESPWKQASCCAQDRQVPIIHHTPPGLSPTETMCHESRDVARGSFILLMVQATIMSSNDLLAHDRESAEQACRRGTYIFGVLLSSRIQMCSAECAMRIGCSRMTEQPILAWSKL